MKLIIEKSPGMRRTVQWRPEGWYDEEPILWRIDHAPVLFLVKIVEEEIVNSTTTLPMQVTQYALVHEKGKFYRLHAPNVQRTSFVCMGDMRDIIETRIMKNKPPNIPDLFWNSVFTSRSHPRLYSWKADGNNLIELSRREIHDQLLAAVENGG